MSKLKSPLGVVANAILSRARTIIIWIVIIALVYVAVRVNAHNRAETVARLSSTNPAVQDEEIMKSARQQKLADALADIQDPNSLPASDTNVADTKIRVACATEFTKLVTKNAPPYNISIGLALANLYDLHKDGALKPVVTAELATLGQQSDANLKQLVTNLGDGDPDIRGASSDALAAIGGQKTIDLLVSAVGVPGERAQALTTLNTIGKPAAPALVAMMATANADFTQSLIGMLATIGDPASIPAIEQEATATPVDPATRRVALLGLSTIIISTVPASPPPVATAPAPAAAPAKPAAAAAPAKAAVAAAPTAPAPPPGPSPQDMANCLSAGPILTAALNNPGDDSRARAQCALAIGRLATGGATIALVKALSDIDTRISQAATNGLAAVGPAAVPALAVAVHSPSETVRIGAATALGSIGTDAAVSAMSSALADPSTEVRRNACEALGRSASKSAVPLLAARLSDNDGFVAGAASSSLQMLGKSAVPALVAALGGVNQTAAFYAAQALTGMGLDAAPQVRIAAQSGTPSQKVWSAVVLGEIRDTDSRALLTSLATNPDPKVKFAASQALQQIGAASAAA